MTSQSFGLDGMATARIPRYLAVYESLKRKIESGEYPTGGLIPTEPELERIYKVSRTTVRSAVDLLASEGFVNIRQGVGTFVLNFKATQRLQYVTSFSETLRDQGFEVRHSVLGIERVVAAPPESTDLGIPDYTELVRMERLAYANDRPIAIMENHLKADLVPGIESRRSEIGSLYAFLEREYGITIDGATDYIRASVAGPEEAEKLNVVLGSPLLIVKRIGYFKAEPTELALLRIVADHYEYAVHTRERPVGAFRETGPDDR